MESFLISVENKAIPLVATNAKKKECNRIVSVCDDRDENINHIMSKCSKLAQK